MSEILKELLVMGLELHKVHASDVQDHELMTSWQHCKMTYCKYRYDLSQQGSTHWLPRAESLKSICGIPATNILYTLIPDNVDCFECRLMFAGYQIGRVSKHGLSVQPAWCRELPLQQQSVLLLGARGPDGIAKTNLCKAVQRAYRATVFLAAQYGRQLRWGEKADSFISLDRFAIDMLWSKDVADFFESVDGLPHHAYQHLMLGAEILGYKHPDERFRHRWRCFYFDCANNLHLNPETEKQMDARLCDWRRERWEA